MPGICWGNIISGFIFRWTAFWNETKSDNSVASFRWTSKWAGGVKLPIWMSSFLEFPCARKQRFISFDTHTSSHCIRMLLKTTHGGCFQDAALLRWFGFCSLLVLIPRVHGRRDAKRVAQRERGGRGTLLKHLMHPDLYNTATTELVYLSVPMWHTTYTKQINKTNVLSGWVLVSWCPACWSRERAARREKFPLQFVWVTLNEQETLPTPNGERKWQKNKTKKPNSGSWSCLTAGALGTPLYVQ